MFTLVFRFVHAVRPVRVVGNVRMLDVRVFALGRRESARRMRDPTALPLAALPTFGDDGVHIPEHARCDGEELLAVVGDGYGLAPSHKGESRLLRRLSPCLPRILFANCLSIWLAARPLIGLSGRRRRRQDVVSGRARLAALRAMRLHPRGHSGLRRQSCAAMRARIAFAGQGFRAVKADAVLDMASATVAVGAGIAHAPSFGRDARRGLPAVSRGPLRAFPKR